MSKKILRHLLIAGTISFAASSPYFAYYLAKGLFTARDKQRFTNTFNNLKRRGLIEVDREGHDVHVSLTKEGEWVTGRFEFNELEITRPKRWDGKWRVIAFDIPHEYRVKRDIFRTKLKELGFYSLQKSVWVYPYECKREIKLVKDFLGLSEDDIRILLVEKIEDDMHLREVYGLR